MWWRAERGRKATRIENIEITNAFKLVVSKIRTYLEFKAFNNSTWRNLK